MQLDFSHVKKCKKPNCRHISARVDRHHRGCEAMWLKHFRHKKRTKRFKEFRERYYKYLKTDCTEICSWHHAEIHAIYLRIISAQVTLVAHSRGQPTKCSSWSWEEAEVLMEKLRIVCDQWLLTQTPGIDPNTKREFHNETA